MKKQKTPKHRNWLAVHAHFRKAGSHKDKKKETSKTLRSDEEIIAEVEAITNKN